MVEQTLLEIRAQLDALAKEALAISEQVIKTSHPPSIETATSPSRQRGKPKRPSALRLVANR
jgi:hypothetical protein